jgi:lipopolysaccharide biosynthesis regulator YciM
MIKNPLITALAGLLVGFFVGYVVGQGGPAPATATAAGSATTASPSRSLAGVAPAPPSGGRTQATANPQLMEEARDLDRLLQQDPNNYQHLVQMGNLQYDLGSYTKAITYYERARAIRDDSPDVMTDLGVAYRESGSPDKALELLDRAAEMSPEHWQSRYNAAVVRLFDLNDPKGAMEELEKLEKAKGDVQGIPDLTGLRQEIEKKLK